MKSQKAEPQSLDALRGNEQGIGAASQPPSRSARQLQGQQPLWLDKQPSLSPLTPHA